MKNSWFGNIVSVLATLLISLMVAACGAQSEPGPSGSSARSSTDVLGTYENANDGVVITLKADNKATMIDEEQSTELTWEMDGADRLVVHGMEGINLIFNVNSEGNLSDDMGLGSVFRKK